MHDVSTLLRQKEQELARLQKEVDALRLVVLGALLVAPSATVAGPLRTHPPVTPETERTKSDNHRG